MNFYSKKSFRLSFLILIFIMSVGEVGNGQEKIFEITDPIGDDYGAGEVVYPENPNFQKGMFDITRFSVSKDDKNVNFEIEINSKIKFLDYYEFEYQYDLPENFFLQFIQIYIDKDKIKGAGFLETLQGCNVKIDSMSAWEHGVVITPLPVDVMREIKGKQKMFSNRVSVPREVRIKQNLFTVAIPIEEIGIPQKNWGYTVLMLAHAFSGSWGDNIYINEVNATASQWNFGGGFARANDPNVIDLIAPPQHTQEKMLYFPDDDQQEFVTLYAVYGSEKLSEEELQNISGEITQVSGEKILVNLGSSTGLTLGSELLVDNRAFAIVTEIFPEMCIAKLTIKNKNLQIKEGMKVTIFSIE